MKELLHTKASCIANDLCLGGADGLFCSNCGAGLKQSKGATLQQVLDSPVYKQVLADSFGGIMYDVANRDKYDSVELLQLWDSLSPVDRFDRANGITKGAINFLKGDN